ncbi:melanocyte-stimulating hormone receptor-like [Montipora capricornis]|uniref:melanocyte-stimulating hormone receptor-like n=1 Tax=Montipora capricornis TaxID=246305 RepID=UPI0035F1B4D0
MCYTLIVFSPAATFGNILAIRALWKASSLPANLRKMFLSLALSDLAVGLFAHLMQAVVFKMALDENCNLDVFCPLTLSLCYFILKALICASFLNITAIAVDRLLAVSLHLRYQELVTSKRVMIALLAIWLVSCASSSVRVFTASPYIAAVLASIGFALTTVAYIQVYKVARYHRNQIENQFQQQNSQETVLLRERKSALNAVYVYVVFVACYLPYFCLFAILLATGNRRGSILVAYQVTFFFLLLNSSLNPLVYCWRFPEIRRITKSIFRVPEE